MTARTSVPDNPLQIVRVQNNGLIIVSVFEGTTLYVKNFRPQTVGRLGKYYPTKNTWKTKIEFTKPSLLTVSGSDVEHGNIDSLYFAREWNGEKLRDHPFFWNHFENFLRNKAIRRYHILLDPATNLQIVTFKRELAVITTIAAKFPKYTYCILKRAELLELILDEDRIRLSQGQHDTLSKMLKALDTKHDQWISSIEQGKTLHDKDFTSNRRESDLIRKILLKYIG